jgi:DNA primase small subunit
MLVRAYRLLEPYFIRDVIVAKRKGGHGLLADADQWMKVLERLPDFAAEVREKLQKNWASSSSTPLDKWKELQRHVAFYAKNDSMQGSDERSKKKTRKLSTSEQQQLELFCTEIVLRYTYPRIDINVSKMRNHLLKSPFCVHPKTGRICVPIPNAQLYSFDPFSVPTVKQIIQELDHGGAAPNVVDHSSSTAPEEEDEMAIDRSSAKDSNDWNQTSLAPYYQAFQKEFLQPLQQAQRQSQRDEREQVAALRGDF